MSTAEEPPAPAGVQLTHARHPGGGDAHHAGSPTRLPAVDRSTFASLKNRDFRLLWIGMLGSAFGMNMQVVAQGWLVYEMTVSELKLAWVTLATTLPQVLFSLAGGAMADRLPKKPLILWTQALNGVATLVLAGIILTGHVTFIDFVWVGFLNGTVMALSMPARTAFIPELVGESLMFNAMAFNTASWNLARILGPALAGVMIAVFAAGNTSSHAGAGIVYGVLSVLYIVSAVTVLGIRHDGVPRRRPPHGALVDVVDSLRYVSRSPLVGGLLLLSLVPFLFAMALNTLLPAFNTDVLGGGADDLGALMTAMGAGAILGSLAVARLGELPRKGFWTLASCAAWGLAVAVFALTTWLPASLLAIGAVGFASAFHVSMNRSIMQLQVAADMRGRIMSIDMMAHGLMPLGVLPISWLAESVSVRFGLAVAGILPAAITLLLWLLLVQVRRVDQGHERT
jgi:MFS family permease